MANETSTECAAILRSPALMRQWMAKIGIDIDTITGTVPNGTVDGQLLIWDNTLAVYVPKLISGDATLTKAGLLTLATVNSNVGSYTLTNLTVDAKGRITAASSGSAGASSFPITYDDGTTTYSITAASQTLTIVSHNDATPTRLVQILFDTSIGGDLDVNTGADMNLVPGRDFNVNAVHDANVIGGHATNLGTSTSPTSLDGTTLTFRSVAFNPTGGSTGDVLTKQAGGSIALQNPSTGVLSQDYRQSFLLMGA